MTAAELRAMQGQGEQKHAAGRNSQAVEVDGIRFHSKHEAERWQDLCLTQKAGQITGLKRQVPIKLMGQNGPILTPTGKVMTFRADFTYRENGKLVVEDAKGHPAPVYLMKKAILAAQGITIKET